MQENVGIHTNTQTARRIRKHADPREGETRRTIAVAMAAGMSIVMDSAPRNLSMNGSERRIGYCMANGTGIGVADFAADLEAIV